MTLWSATQIPHILRLLAAATLGMSETKVRVIAPDVGGGFGSKLDVYAEELLAVALARRLGRPVKWIGGALGELPGDDPRPRLRDDARARRDEGRQDHARSGRDVHASMGAYLQLVTPGIPLLGAWIYAGPVRDPELQRHVHGRLHEHDADRRLPRRRPARRRPTCSSARWTSLADELGIDRLELRRKNFITEFPATMASGLTIDNGDYHASLDRLLEHLDLDALQAEQARRRERGDVEADRRRLLDLQRDVRPRTVADPRRDPLRRRRLGAGDDPLPADRHRPGRHRHLAARPGPRDGVVADRRRPARLRARPRSRCCTATRASRIRARHVRQPEPSGRRASRSATPPRRSSTRRAQIVAHQLEVSADDLEYADGTFARQGLARTRR